MLDAGGGFLAQASLYQAGVVLLDMRMPVLDGQGVHDALRQCGSTLAVVFLPGMAMCRWPWSR